MALYFIHMKKEKITPLSSLIIIILLLNQVRTIMAADLENSKYVKVGNKSGLNDAVRCDVTLPWFQIAMDDETTGFAMYQGDRSEMFCTKY